MPLNLLRRIEFDGASYSIVELAILLRDTSDLNRVLEILEVIFGSETEG